MERRVSHGPLQHLFQEEFLLTQPELPMMGRAPPFLAALGYHGPGLVGHMSQMEYLQLLFVMVFLHENPKKGKVLCFKNIIFTFPLLFSNQECLGKSKLYTAKRN